MKLLSALILSLGLSVSVWADEAAPETEIQSWSKTVNGLFGQTCQKFTQQQLDVQSTGVDARALMAGHFSSFLSGYNYSTYLSNILNGEVPGSEHVGDNPYFDTSRLNDVYIIVDSISLKCRSNPDRMLMWTMVEWMGENPQLMK